MKFYGIKINRLLISSHHYERHFDVSDEVIYNLIIQLNEIDEIDPEPFIGNKEINFRFFVFERLFNENKAYKIIVWLEKDRNYIGVRTCFRNKKYDKR